MTEKELKFNFVNPVFYRYLSLLKDIQEMREDCGGTPYGFEEKRVEAHYELMRELQIEETTDNYIKFKEVTDNLNRVCEIYSVCDEWKLKTDNDCAMMARYLERFCRCSKFRRWMEGEPIKLFVERYLP